MSNAKKVLVTGATGQQGGAVARQLLARGHAVRGMTRNVDSDASKALIELGAEMVTGDFEDGASLIAVMTGVDAVYAMSTPFEAGEEAEVRQGRALVDAAVAASVPHFVYSSVASANLETGIPHFDSKYEIEKYLATTDLPWTVVAPVYFMENLFFPQNLDGLRGGAYAIPMPAGVPLQQVAVADIGAFGAHVIERGDELIGRRIDIAGDELNATDTATALGGVLSREVGSFEVPIQQIRSFSEDMALMYEWFVSTGYSVDIDELRSEFSDVKWHRYSDWATGSVPAAL